MLSEIWRHFYIHNPFFLLFQIWPFWPQKPKNSNLTNSFLKHYAQPKMNQKSPKDPKSMLILTMKLLHTYFWKTLPIGALIWLTLIWLIWAQIAQPTSNHLQIDLNDFTSDLNILEMAPEQMFASCDIGWLVGCCSLSTPGAETYQISPCNFFSHLHHNGAKPCMSRFSICNSSNIK